MPKKSYTVKLREQEKLELLKVVKTGKAAARVIMHANILLATDENRQPRLTVAQVAEKLNLTTTTVQTVRRTYSSQGYMAAVYRKKRNTPPITPKITGEVEAHIIATVCGAPPEGFSRWSLRLLADKVVELKYIDKISYVSVSSVLKKHNLSLT